MASSERDESTEQPTREASDPEPTPEVVFQPSPQFIDAVNEPDDPEGNGIEEPAGPEAVEPAEPGIYVCEHEHPGEHPILGTLRHGENDFTAYTDPRVLQALAEAVRDGLLQGPVKGSARTR